MIETAWPDLWVVARDAGRIDPHDPAHAGRFRGEEAFDPAVTGWRRWSKPSPEPRLDAAFEEVLCASIRREAPWIAAAVERVAAGIAAEETDPPVLVAILRAGVPVASLLARRLERRWGAPVPVAALSLFHGLGWDEAALAEVLARWPGRPVWFVDGWTSRGGVARELGDSYRRWLAAGRADFTGGRGPRLAVLCDPAGRAQAAATRADRFVPSACFTAPRTLGFSRGFADGEGRLFRVYTFPPSLVAPRLIEAWMAIDGVEPSAVDAEPEAGAAEPPPDGWRIHVNEVARALINRQPREVLLVPERDRAEASLAPLLHLCRLRGVPVRFGRAEIAAWGTLAAARMVGDPP